MDSRKKLQAISARLGQPKQTAPKKGEYGFLCPGKPGAGGCSSAPQGKIRLWVNPDRDEFHCWHCGYGGKSLAPLMVRGSAEHREYLGERHDIAVRAQPVLPPCNSLPDGFTPFGRRETYHEAPYLSYLRGRGVSERTMALYRMGYVDDGPLAGRVVIPSFDQTGAINFWSARSIHPVEKVHAYRLPKATKNIVSNAHMVDWSKPVYIVEGIFDEIAIGPQAIALYGKFMNSQLAVALVTNRPPVTYVCLDNDARGDAEDIVERLLGYDLPCALVDLADKDPAVAGAAAVQSAAMGSYVLTGSMEALAARLRAL